ncbi:TetR/AcrR family transcriptional regulator [Acinetobacter sp. WCHAc060033]|nr:TetR/AcrR family transcriptional regulator [Acinetobacter sp. WCHAc060033]
MLMANLRQDQAQETKEKLLVQARKLFAEKGYANTSIRALAKSLDMSEGILYHHFSGGKREILAVMVQQGLAEVLMALNQKNHNLEQQPLAIVLATLYEMCEQLFNQSPELLKIIMRESDVMGLEEVHIIQNVIRSRIEWLANLLRQRCALGEVREMNFELSAQQFLAMSIQYALGKLLNMNVGYSLSKQQDRQAIVEHTLMLWAPIS